MPVKTNSFCLVLIVLVKRRIHANDPMLPVLTKIAASYFDIREIQIDGPRREISVNREFDKIPHQINVRTCVTFTK